MAMKSRFICTRIGFKIILFLSLNTQKKLNLQNFHKTYLKSRYNIKIDF